jgi:2-oxoglutarate ferredoxin oxidoreductase subunit delta
MPDRNSGKKVFRVEVLTEYCKGCGLCIEVCREGKLVRDERPNAMGLVQVHVDPDAACTGCKRCALVCPDAAIEIFRSGGRKAAAARVKVEGE